MTPVYVSVIYFCIRSLVRHPRTLQSGVFDLRCSENQDTGDRVNARCWLVDFSTCVFPAVKSNPVENAPCDVAREILVNIIHTHRFKIRKKQLNNLFTPLVIFIVTKCHVLVIMSKATSEVLALYQRNRTVHSFRERYRLTVLYMYQWNCGCDGTERGFT